MWDMFKKMISLELIGVAECLINLVRKYIGYYDFNPKMRDTILESIYVNWHKGFIIDDLKQGK